MNKLLIFLITLILCTGLVSAYEIKVVDKSIDKQRYQKIINSVNKTHLEGISTIYIGTDEQVYRALAWYELSFKKTKKGKITKILRSEVSLNYNLDDYNDAFIKCVLIHELGHHNEMVNTVGYKQKKMSEEYANNFSANNGCTDKWYLENYVTN